MDTRVIKFRIWDKKFKRFRYEDDEHQEVDDAGETIGWYETCGEDANIFFSLLKDIREDDRWVLQQFTGSYDKNGKELYEGDVTGSDDKRRYLIKWVTAYSGPLFSDVLIVDPEGNMVEEKYWNEPEDYYGGITSYYELKGNIFEGYV